MHRYPIQGTVQRKRPIGGLLPDILEVLAGLEANRSARRDANFLARPWVASDAALAGLHLKDPESAQLDAIPALHGQTHGVEYGVNRDLSFDFGDIGDFRDFVDDVDLDHVGILRLCQKPVTTIKRVTYAVN